MANLVWTKQEHGKLEGAEEIQERVLELCKDTGRKESPEMIEVMVNLGVTKNINKASLTKLNSLKNEC